MLPPVTTGPMDPAWSSDGRWFAFSMRGDTWKVPAEGARGGSADGGPGVPPRVGVEPDGSRVALTMDVDGTLDIGVVSAEGGAVQRITMDPVVDVEPDGSRDGSYLYWGARSPVPVTAVPASSVLRSGLRSR
jgi:Tol biopolymer transport system component